MSPILSMLTMLAMLIMLPMLPMLSMLPMLTMLTMLAVLQSWRCQCWQCINTLSLFWFKRIDQQSQDTAFDIQNFQVVQNSLCPLNEQITLASGTLTNMRARLSSKSGISLVLTSGICDVPPTQSPLLEALQNILTTKHPRSPDLSPCVRRQRHKHERWKGSAEALESQFKCELQLACFLGSLAVAWWMSNGWWWLAI